jgi:hypothetical protein
MAHNDYGAASWAQFTTDPGNPDAELAAPLLFAQGPFQQQLPPMYQSQHMPSGNPSVSQIQDASNVPTSSHPPRVPPLPSIGNRHQHYPPYAHPYQIVTPQRPSSVWNGAEQWQPGQAFYDNGVMQQGYQPFYPPGASSYNPQLSASSNPGTSPLSRRRHDQRISVGSVARNAHADTVRGSQERHRGPPPGARAQDPRPPPQVPSHASEQSYPGLGQPPWSFSEGPSRRSDRSTSPRSSNRRNFERYSVDLSQSSTSSDAEEAAARAPPLNRMRHRPREVRPRYVGRHPHVDPNLATTRQIQELKHSLQRHLPSALPEKASKACDICQKDYATTHVQPTEEEEIAVELACGHTFGEFCISQWVSVSIRRIVVTC